jgi:hypothetical protein
VVSDLPELLVHDVKVVKEPLLGERDLTLLPDRLDDVVVRGQKCAPVLADPGKKIPSFAGPLGGSLGRGQALGVLLKALDPEQLGADRLFYRRRTGDHAVGGAHFRSRSAGGKILS